MTAVLAVDHLPGLLQKQLRRVSIPGTDVLVAKLHPEHVIEVWEWLDEITAHGRTLSIGTRARSLAHAAQALRHAGPGEWEDLLVRSTGLSREGLHAAWEATFAPWDRTGIDALLVREGVEVTPAHLLPRRIVHILAGNVLPPTFALIARGMLLGASQWLRPASREPVFAACLLDRIRRLGVSELLGACAVSWWPPGDPIEADVVRSADVVTVTGDDASIAAVRRRVAQLAPSTRLVGFGTRWSLGLVSAGGQRQATAHGMAWDVALFDQQGCLSPSLVLAEDHPGLEPWCEQLAAGFAALEKVMPRGAASAGARAGLRLWQEQERLGLATGAVRRLWEGSGTTWAVSLRDRLEWASSPLDRHVPVVPFRDPAEIPLLLGDRLASLQGIAADLSGWDEPGRDALFAALRPSRIAAPGTLQLAPPAWPQDHLAPLRSLLA